MHKPITYTELKTALLLYMPFFASLLLDKMAVKIGKFEVLAPFNTAGTNGKIIYIDEDYFKTLKLVEAVFLVCHEIAHAMWMHMDRGKRYLDAGIGPDGKYKFVPLLWNIAADFVINDMLVTAKIGKHPKGALLNPKYSGSMLVEDVYKDLVKECKDKEKGQGESSDGSGDGEEREGQSDDSGGQGDNKVFDVHILETDGTSKAEWKRAVKSAADAAKAQGKMPAGISRFVDELLNPVVPWQEKLRFSLQKVISRESHTWTKLHRRRFVSQGIIFPGYTGFGAGTVVVAVDTSGSIGVKELTRFMSELDGILSDARPKELWVLGCDAAIHDTTLLVQGDNLRDNPPPLKGGGGTSFKPPFKWVADNDIRPSALVYLTDMYGDFPEEPDYPVIWCATSDLVAKFGETIRIPVEKE